MQRYTDAAILTTDDTYICCEIAANLERCLM